MNITLKQLMIMKDNATEPIDIENLVDIRDIKVNQELSVTDKILEFIALSKNPYIFRYGDKVVRVKFADTDITFEERMKGYFEML